MKKLVLLIALFFAMGMQAKNIKVTKSLVVVPQLTKDDAPQKVDYMQEPGDWCDWWAGVYVADHSYGSDAERDAARAGYYDRCMEDGGDHA